MKPGLSTLNPYAAAYIPLAKRDSQPEEVPKHQLRHKAVLEGDSRGTAAQLGQDVFSMKSQSVHGSCNGSSQYESEVLEKQMMDLEFDMVMDYLQTAFPGLSKQSLADVYFANNGDIEATVDMLSQLEFRIDESSEGLPDTLDIGDVSESGSSSHCASLKQKNVPGAAEGSSESTDSQVVS